MSATLSESSKRGGGANDSASHDAAPVERSAWEANVLRSNPGFLALRERTTPLTGEASFASRPGAAHTEVEAVLARPRVVALIVQWLREQGHHKTAAQVLRESGVTFVDNGLGAEQLVAVLQASAPEDSAIFAANSDERLLNRVGDDVEDREVVVTSELPGGFWADADGEDSPWAEGEEGEPPDGMLSLSRVGRMMVQCDDPEFKPMVAATHSAWSSAAELLRLLFQLYFIPASSPLHGTDEALAHETRVIRAISWFALSSKGPLELVVGLLTRFSTRLADMGRSKHAHELRQTLAHLQGGRDRESRGTAPRKWEDPLVPKNIFSPLLTLRDVPLEEVARQLTLIDHGLFCAISSGELLSMGWRSTVARSRKLSPNVCALLHRFVLLQRWVAGKIERERSPSAQQTVLSYFIQLARRLLDLNSFHSAMALTAGIQSQRVWRQRGVFALLSADDVHDLTQLEAASRRKPGFDGYQHLLSQAQLASPVVPFLHPHLQALCVAMLASPSHSPDGRFVNVPKFRAIFRLISDLQVLLARQYPYLVVHQVKRFLTDEALVSQGTISDE